MDESNSEKMEVEVTGFTVSLVLVDEATLEMGLVLAGEPFAADSWLVDVTRLKRFSGERLLTDALFFEALSDPEELALLRRLPRLPELPSFFGVVASACQRDWLMLVLLDTGESCKGEVIPGILLADAPAARFVADVEAVAPPGGLYIDAPLARSK